MTQQAAPTDPKLVVGRGYDQIGERYLAWSALRPSPARLQALRWADERIPPGAHVLELGCGAGIPMTATIATGRHVTGVDISPGQIERARANVPTAEFVVADMATLDWPEGSFDAVVAFYSLTHLPREELRPLLGRIGSWIRPGGLFVASFGVEDDPGGIERDWLGVEMFFSHFSARTNRRLVVEAGFEIEIADVLVEPEDRFDARFLWIVARTPAAGRERP